MILLTAPRIESGQNLPTTNDLYAAVTNVSVSPYAQTLVITISYGNKVGGVFVPDTSIPPALIVTANLSTNPALWSASNAEGFVVNGTLTPGAQTAPIQSLITAIQGAQPTIEGFLSVNGGLMPGTYQAG